MFDVVLQPFISKHEAKIDRCLVELRLKTADIAALFWHKTTSCSQTTLLDLLRNVSWMPTSQTCHNQVLLMRRLSMYLFEKLLQKTL